MPLVAFPLVTGKMIVGGLDAALSIAPAPVWERSVEARVQPILMTAISSAPVGVQVHCGMPLLS